MSRKENMIMRTGVANLPLHTGQCPRWLFGRMKRLGGAMAEAIVLEYGQGEFLKRLSDPFWFQAFGCVLGFDWHSSGLSTTVCGALKESVNRLDVGVAIAGGKGKASRKAPSEIMEAGENFSLSDKKIQDLKYSSRMAAKVDSACVQDGYQLYHHSFFFSERGEWCVVQQGMNPGNKYARRYHWLSGFESFVEEPHSGIASQKREESVLNMVARESGEAREVSLDLVRDNPNHIRRFLTGQAGLGDFLGIGKALHMPRSHYIIGMGERELKTLQDAYEIQPKNYEELLSVRGIGPKSVRALALVSDLIYGKGPSWEDPARFSFAHGGKDGIPYPTDRKLLDSTTNTLKDAIESARIGNREKIGAIRRLQGFIKS